MLCTIIKVEWAVSLRYLEVECLGVRKYLPVIENRRRFLWDLVITVVEVTL